jgi:predicted nucleic acid-binding protein
MSSATLTSPPTATARLVVDTDVASFLFKWHPELAPRYVRIVRGPELVVSFMTVAEMRQGAADANLGGRASAVTALALLAPLVTTNPKDYRHLDRLQVISETD